MLAVADVDLEAMLARRLAQAEEALKASVEREAASRRQAEIERHNLHALLTRVPAGVAIIRGPDLRYELSNPVHEHLTGGRELVGKTIDEGLPELAAQGFAAIAREVLRTGTPFIAN